MNRKHWTAILCLGLAALVGGAPLMAAEPDPLDQLKVKMTKDGWREVAPGVFERQLGPNEVERLGYGREGLAWTIGELTRKLARLQQERESYPSEKLDKVIADLAAHLAKFKTEIRKMDSDPEGHLSNVTAAVSGGSCSSICYSATANAYPLGSGGVAASASATFNSACGYSGETFAYAYARATQATTTTTTSQSDPKSGTSITSTANASANGGSVTGIPCYSEASSYAQSSALGISYSTSAVNNSCPVPNMSVAVSGQSYLYFTDYNCYTYTWSPIITNGVAPYSYAWYVNGSYAGSGSTYSRSVCGYDASFNVSVTVTGSNAQSATSPPFYVDVYLDYNPNCNPYGPPYQLCPYL